MRRCMPKHTTIDLPDDVDAELARLSAQTGRARSLMIVQAIRAALPRERRIAKMTAGDERPAKKARR